MPSGYASGQMTRTAVDESDLIAALRRRDEVAFADLVDRHTASMLRVARGYVRTHETAEEVVQDTWIALFRGIDTFEGRSSLRTWLFTVLIKIAKARGVRERRDGDAAAIAHTGGVVDPARFRPNGDELAGHWRPQETPTEFPETPEGSVLAHELTDVARRAIDGLPEPQRVVVTLRDMLGFDSDEVRDLLDLSVANQRVLLHRGRSAIRQVLEDYMREGT